MSQTAAPRRAGRAALAFIFITVLLDMMALGMVAPVLPKLVTGFLSGNTSQAAVVYGLFNTVFALMQFFFSPVIGSLSDRFGRKPVILASNLGLGLNYVLMAWAPSLGWLFVGRVISGITGASFGTASAYIADTTPADERAHAFGMLGAAFGVGFVIGPALGGLLGEFSPKLPFWVAAGFSLANALYGLFVLPESLPKENRHGFCWKRANPVGALGLLRRHPELMALAGVLFLSNLAQVSLPSTVVLYATHRYGWTPTWLGVTLAMVGVALIVVQVGVVGRFVRRFGSRAALVTGLCFGCVGLFVAGVAKTGGAFWMGIPVLAMWGLAGAAGQGIMTRHVTATEQGQLQGATASLVGISELIGPSIFTLTFAYFVRPGQPVERAGAPFLLASGLLAVAAVWAFIATRREAEFVPPQE
ncbi:MAG TPA: TCR/Tet family MFS transporter [Caulobacteraceae bacterium]|jgi:DHA1 family tetracycline resistance protein-like MFS transporter|nr:TCR/Tet family MFS transporter [Caulobacteraceae bacterium]